MSDTMGARAALRRSAPDSGEVGQVTLPLEITLRVTDPDVLEELRRREGTVREEFAQIALRIGVLALRQASGTLDGQTLRTEGERLVALVEGKLGEHAKELKTRLESELGNYFDPNRGHFAARVRELTDDKGGFAGLLKRHIEGDTSTLAQSLARAVGDNSPLMKHLSPKEKDGLVETIARVVQERLEEQSKRVLAEFDLNNDQSALKRLINNVNEISREISEQFNPEEEKSALAKLNNALELTRGQIAKDLTLDDDESALSRLHEKLRAQFDDLLERQTRFQKDIAERLGIKQVQARTTEGGFTFEHAVGDALRQRVRGLGDEFAAVGELSGVQGRKTGDYVQTMGAESAAPGANIVYECKRDRRYRIKVALEEMAQARTNRNAEIGVFVMDARTVRDNADLHSEYPAALTRFGNDIIVVWDAENEATDVVLDAAISLARALVLRAAKHEESESAEELEDIAKAIADIEKQFERFDDMSKRCDDIMTSAKEVSGYAYDIQEELRKVLKRLRSDVKSLNEGVKALRDTAE